MRTGLSTLATNILDQDDKTDMSWLLEIDLDDNGSIDYRLSTKHKSYLGNDYSDINNGDNHVIDFTPIRLTHSSAGIEYLQTAAATVIQISNPGSALIPSDFQDAAVTIRLIMEADLKDKTEPEILDESGIDPEPSHVCETEIVAWSFKVNRAWTIYQVLHLHCVDWLEQYSEGDYPKTPLISQLWPGLTPQAYEDKKEDNICVPKIWGTVYFPVRWVQTADAMEEDYYVLGEHVAEDYYGIDEIMRPKETGYNGKWVSGGTDVSFTVIKKTADGDGKDYDLGKFVIRDGGSNYYENGPGIHPDIPCKLRKTSTQNMTNPIKMYRNVLEDMGVPTSKFNEASYKTARDYWTAKGLTLSVPLYKKEPRKVILSRLSTMCHTRLIIRDELHFKVNFKASQHTINSSWIMKGMTGQGSFTFNPIIQNEKKDSGEGLYRESTLPIDNPTTFLVSMGTTKDEVAKDKIDCTYITDAVHAQIATILALQRALLPDGRVSVKLKSKCLQLECGDVVTVEGSNYNAISDYDFLINTMIINRDASVDIVGTTFREAT